VFVTLTSRHGTDRYKEHIEFYYYNINTYFPCHTVRHYLYGHRITMCKLAAQRKI